MPKRKDPKSESPRQRGSKTTVEETLDYWTPEAMAAATPLRLQRDRPKPKPRKERDDG